MIGQGKQEEGSVRDSEMRGQVPPHPRRPVGCRGSLALDLDNQLELIILGIHSYVDTLARRIVRRRCYHISTFHHASHPLDRHGVISSRGQLDADRKDTLLSTIRHGRVT